MSNVIVDNPIHSFIDQGYLLFNKGNYNLQDDSSELQKLLDAFNHLTLDPSPGSRHRAYLKLLWDNTANQLSISEDQRYFQTSYANNLDGDKIRNFQTLSLDIFHNVAMQKIINANIAFIKMHQELLSSDKLIFGVHFIRYQATAGAAAYSSPIWLHIDDEPIVFLHLMDLSSNMIGGDTIIANKKGAIQKVIRLKDCMETLVVNRNVLHAVTPMGSTKGTATRDIILFTVEPASTNEIRAI